MSSQVRPGPAPAIFEIDICCVISVGDIGVIVADSGQAGLPGGDEGGIIQAADAAYAVRGKPPLSYVLMCCHHVCAYRIILYGDKGT